MTTTLTDLPVAPPAQKGKGPVFRPYTSSAAAGSAHLLQKTFRIRQCDDSFTAIALTSLPTAPDRALQCAPVGLISPEAYRE